MPYGPKKLSSQEIKDAIADCVRDGIAQKLGASDAFSNPSLCYVGVKFEYDIKIEFASRQNTKLGVEGSGETELSDFTVVKVKGKHSAGTLKEKK